MEFIIRPALLGDAGAIALVHVESWRSTYAGIVPDSHLASLNINRRASMWRNSIMRGGGLIFVTETERGVEGFVTGGALRDPIEGYDAEMYAIYLLREWQRQGMGRALVRALAGALVERGHKSMAVWVLDKNPAVGFYQRLGGIQIAQKGIEIGGMRLEELGFGWPTLDALV
jgi:ribosomal protein S18 acetylase RimI-like enzyme